MTDHNEKPDETNATLTILVVEDEKELRRFLRAALTTQGYPWLEASTLREARQLAVSEKPALILLDLGLPDGDGLTLVSELREWSRVPIIVISARGREDDKVRALDAGADDYLTKPFGTNELFARMRVALRRIKTSEAEREDPVLRFDALTIDRAKRSVFREGTELHLTPIEYKLLVFLAEHAGKVLTHRQILKEVWGSQYATQTHYVRVHMAELRKKVEADPSMPRLIVTESGVGYRLKG